MRNGVAGRAGTAGSDAAGRLTHREGYAFRYHERDYIPQTQHLHDLHGEREYRPYRRNARAERCQRAPRAAHAGRERALPAFYPQGAQSDCAAFRLDAAGILPGSHAGDGARAGRVAQNRRYRPGSVARRYALLAHPGNRTAPDYGHEITPSGSGDGSDDGL